MKKYCYMTYVDKNFINCVIKQNEQLHFLKSQYPFIILVDKNDLYCIKLLEKK